MHKNKILHWLRYDGTVSQIIFRQILCIIALVCVMETVLCIYLYLTHQAPPMRAIVTLFAFAAVAGPVLVGLLCFAGTAAHELGHWLAIRMFRHPVRSVSIGCGPLLRRWHWHKTPWSIHVGIGGGLVDEDRDALAKRPALTQAWFDIVCSLAGPAAGMTFACPLACLWLYRPQAEDPADLVRMVVGLAAIFTAGANCLALIPLPKTDGWFALVGCRRLYRHYTQR